MRDASHPHGAQHPVIPTGTGGSPFWDRSRGRAIQRGLALGPKAGFWLGTLGGVVLGTLLPQGCFDMRPLGLVMGGLLGGTLGIIAGLALGPFAALASMYAPNGSLRAACGFVAGGTAAAGIVVIAGGIPGDLVDAAPAMLSFAFGAAVGYYTASA